MICPDLKGEAVPTINTIRPSDQKAVYEVLAQSSNFFKLYKNLQFHFFYLG